MIVVECEEASKFGSGDRFGGVGWGIVVSNISERSSVEKVRLASSAVDTQLALFETQMYSFAYFSESEARHAVCASFAWKVSPVSHRHATN